MIVSACINEIFSSLQGEGLYAGERMTFIRFASCKLGCVWCDTGHSINKTCNIFDSGTDNIKCALPNPIGIVQLNEILGDFEDKTVAITGGEPLEQADFLLNFLPVLHRRRRILLETNGIYHKELGRISGHVDIISTDIKLPSSTGRKAFWEEHGLFLKAALESRSELYIKLVVTSSTTDRDINESIKLISGVNRHIPVFLQPVTPTDKFPESISEDRLLSFKRLFGAWLPNVSITPQMHKEWGVK